MDTSYTTEGLLLLFLSPTPTPVGSGVELGDESSWASSSDVLKALSGLGCGSVQKAC